MKKFSFLDYVTTIWDLARINGVDVGIAYDFLRTDIRTGNRANSMGVAYNLEAAHDAWMHLTEAEQKAAYAEWHAFLGHCYEGVCARRDDPAAVVTFVEGYRAAVGK